MDKISSLYLNVELKAKTRALFFPCTRIMPHKNIKISQPKEEHSLWWIWFVMIEVCFKNKRCIYNINYHWKAYIIVILYYGIKSNKKRLSTKNRRNFGLIFCDCVFFHWNSFGNTILLLIIYNFFKEMGK